MARNSSKLSSSRISDLLHAERLPQFLFCIRRQALSGYGDQQHAERLGIHRVVMIVGSGLALPYQTRCEIVERSAGAGQQDPVETLRFGAGPLSAAADQSGASLA